MKAAVSAGAAASVTIRIAVSPAGPNRRRYRRDDASPASGTARQSAQRVPLGVSSVWVGTSVKGRHQTIGPGKGPGQVKQMAGLARFEDAGYWKAVAPPAVFKAAELRPSEDFATLPQ